MKSKLLIGLVGIISTTHVLAAVLPKNCKTDQISKDKKQMLLHTELNYRPQLVLLHNISKQEIIISHMSMYLSVSAGWSSYLRNRNWSALMVVQPRFSLFCSKMNEEKFLMVDCNKVLEACYYNNFKDENNLATGTYWIAEDAPLEKLIEKIEARKIFVNSEINSQQ